MKTKLIILSSVAVLSAGIWYLFLRDQKSSKSEEGMDPVGPVKKEDNYSNHIRKVTHKAKEPLTQTDLPPDQEIILG